LEVHGHWSHHGTIKSAPQFSGKKFKIEIDSSIWREEIQNRNRLLNLAGRKNRHSSSSSLFNHASFNN
jgi:hypothetical protein